MWSRTGLGRRGRAVIAVAGSVPSCSPPLPGGATRSLGRCHDDEGRVRHGTRPCVFQRPVFNSVQMRVYWRSTSGGSTAKVNSFASTSAGG